MAFRKILSQNNTVGCQAFLTARCVFHVSIQEIPFLSYVLDKIQFVKLNYNYQYLQVYFMRFIMYLSQYK